MRAVTDDICHRSVTETPTPARPRASPGPHKTPKFSSTDPLGDGAHHVERHSVLSFYACGFHVDCLASDPVAEGSEASGVPRRDKP